MPSKEDVCAFLVNPVGYNRIGAGDSPAIIEVYIKLVGAIASGALLF